MGVRGGASTAWIVLASMCCLTRPRAAAFLWSQRGAAMQVWKGRFHSSGALRHRRRNDAYGTDPEDPFAMWEFGQQRNGQGEAMGKESQ